MGLCPAGAAAALQVFLSHSEAKFMLVKFAVTLATNKQFFLTERNGRETGSN